MALLGTQEDPSPIVIITDVLGNLETEEGLAECSETEREEESSKIIPTKDVTRMKAKTLR